MFSSLPTLADGASLIYVCKIHKACSGVGTPVVQNFVQLALHNIPQNDMDLYMDGYMDGYVDGYVDVYMVIYGWVYGDIWMGL